MKSKKASENELKTKLINVRKEINSLSSYFDIGNGSGFGGSEPEERQLKYNIECKRDEERSIMTDLNNLSLKRTKKSSNIAAWLATVAALISAITAVITLLHKP